MSMSIDAEFCGLPCRVLMNKAPPTALSEEKLVDVTNRLLGVDFKAVIVFEDNEPIGLITMSDIMRWLIEEEDKNKLTMKDLISVPLITADIETPLIEVLNLFNKYSIKYIGICEERQVKGLLTEDGIKSFCTQYPHYLRQLLK